MLSTRTCFAKPSAFYLPYGAWLARLQQRWGVACCMTAAFEVTRGAVWLIGLENDEYVRKTDGYLPTAEVAFIDEIFKANSAILNALLTLLNERLFDNGNKRYKVPLLCLVRSASNSPNACARLIRCQRFIWRAMCFQNGATYISFASLPLVECTAVMSYMASEFMEGCWAALRAGWLQVGASNELPESEELDALYDRFLIRRQVAQVSSAQLPTLARLAAGNPMPAMAPPSADGNGAAPSALGAAELSMDDFRCLARAHRPPACHQVE